MAEQDASETLTPLRRLHTNNEMVRKRGGFRLSSPFPPYLPRYREHYKVDDPNAPGPRLMRIMDLSGKDLDDNRNGFLSPRERRRLAYRLLRLMLCHYGFVLLISCFIPIVLSFLWLPFMKGLTILALIGSLLLLLAAFGAEQYNLFLDLWDGQVARVHGEPEIYPRTRRLRRYLRVKTTEMDASEEIYRALVQDEVYDFYYLPRSCLFVAAQYVPPTS